MVKCPHCASDKRQNKAGRARFGSQRYFCCACARTYTPVPKPQGHPAALRQEAVPYRLEGVSQRKTARLLGVSLGSVANWQAQATARPQEQAIEPVPPQVA